jgi:hypothetical protein
MKSSIPASWCNPSIRFPANAGQMQVNEEQNTSASISWFEAQTPFKAQWFFSLHSSLFTLHSSLFTTLCSLNPTIVYHGVIVPCKTATGSGNEKRQSEVATRSGKKQKNAEMRFLPYQGRPLQYIGKIANGRRYSIFPSPGCLPLRMDV